MLARANLQLWCLSVEHRQHTAAEARRSAANLAAWLATPTYQRKAATGVTEALDRTARHWQALADRAALMPATWQTVVWSPGEGLRLEVGHA